MPAANWPAATAWPSATSWPSGTSWPSSSGFNGNFASLFTGVLQSVQSDLGLTYGGTPLATAGNTSTTVLTLSGTLGTVPVPIWAKATNTLSIGSGAQFSIYYDGTGTTAAMTGVTPTAGVGVALTGAGTGLTLTWGAGASVTNDSWKATCSALADQSGNAVHASQATPSAQPLVATGLNGVASLLFDGANQFLSYTLALPAPGTTPTFFWAVWRYMSVQATTRCFTGDTPGTGMLFYLPASASSPQLYNGSGVNAAAGPTAGAWGRAEALFSNSAGDYAKWGATKATGANAGNTVPSANRRIADANGANKLDMELLAFVTMNSLPGAPTLAAASAAATAKYGGSVAV